MQSLTKGVFGRRKKDSEKPKQRWFFKVETLDDANRAILLGYSAFYGLAIAQCLILGVLAAIDSVPVSSLENPLVSAFLALMLYKWRSRTAAVYSLLHAGSIFLLALMSIAWPHIVGLPGMNSVMAAMLVYGAYMAIKGTFRYHKILNTTVIWRNVLIKSASTAAYMIIAFALLVLGSKIGPWERTIHSETPDTAVMNLVSLALTALMLLVITGASFNIMPGTRRNLVAIEADENRP